jgi:biopolymer transport protein ExbD
MPANAVFTRLPRVDLGELVAAAGDDDPQAFQAFLAANGTSVADFDYDGDFFSALLPILSEDYDIDLETSENEVVADIAEATEALVFILTLDDQEKYLAKLNPDNFSEEELAEAYEDFTEEEEEEAGEAMLAGIAALYQSLQEVDADHVVIVTVG